MILMNESTGSAIGYTAETDDVALKLEAFVMAARHSDDVYSVTQLQEMVASALAEPITEGAKFWLTGKDDALIEDFRKRIASKIKTEADRQKLLDEIDDAIDNSNRILTTHDIKNALGSMLVNVFSMGFAYWLRVAVRFSNADKRKSFRETLHLLRSEVKNLKIEK